MSCLERLVPSFMFVRQVFLCLLHCWLLSKIPWRTVSQSTLPGYLTKQKSIWGIFHFCWISIFRPLLASTDHADSIEWLFRVFPHSFFLNFLLLVFPGWRGMLHWVIHQVPSVHYITFGMAFGPLTVCRNRTKFMVMMLHLKQLSQTGSHGLAVVTSAVMTNIVNQGLGC